VNLIILLWSAPGIGLGVLLRERRALIKWSGRATTWSSICWSFAWGVPSARTGRFSTNLGRMGWQAVLICIGGDPGQRVLVRLVSPYLLPRTHEE